MTRFVRHQELLLLAAAACVPIALALATWPPAVPVQRTIVVQAPPADCDEAAVAVEPAEVEPAEVEPAEVEPAEVEPAEVEVEPVVEPAEAEPAGFWWVVTSHEGPGPQLVLSTTPEEAWAMGPVRALDADGMVARGVDEEALPAALRIMTGRRVQLYTAEGAACGAVVGPPQLVAELEGDIEVYGLPDDEEIDRYVDYYEQPEDERRVAAAPSIWDGGRRLLVASLAVEVGCAGTPGLLWARPEEQAPVTVMRAGSERRPSSRVARSFLGRPELVELARDFREWAERDREHRAEAEPAEAEPAGAEPLPRLRDTLRATRWLAVDGEIAAVTVSTEGDAFASEGCGDYLGPEWGLAVVGAEGKAGPVHVGPHGTPISVLDLEGDGQLEVIVTGWWEQGTRLMTITPTGMQELAVLPDAPYYGCPC